MPQNILNYDLINTLTGKRDILFKIFFSLCFYS